MKFFASKRSNLQVFAGGTMYVDIRYSNITVQALSVNIAAGIVRANAIPTISSLAVPLWLVIDEDEVVIIADVSALPGVEIIVRSADGSSRLLPEATNVWSVGIDTLTADIARCVSSLTKIGAAA